MIKKQKGQMTIESVLLVALLLGVSTFVSRYFKKNQMIENLVSEPWIRLSSMLQNGVWKSKPNSLQFHPLQKERNKSISGDQ